MRADWRLRAATDADADRLALVGAATFLEGFAGILDGDAIVAHCAAQHAADTYRRYLARPTSAAWLIEAATGAAPLGYALLAAPDLPDIDPAGPDRELKRIYLLPRLQGSGAAGALMAAAIATARAAGAPRLLIGVYRENARAIAFYRRQGFGDIGTRRFRVGDRLYDDLVLAKAL